MPRGLTNTVEEVRKSHGMLQFGRSDRAETREITDQIEMAATGPSNPEWNTRLFRGRMIFAGTFRVWI
jgi:hypothetical protein